MAEVLARSLPMQMSETMTLRSAMAIGPRITGTVEWHMSQSDLTATLSAAQMTLDQLITKLDVSTQSMLCSQEPMKAFIGLGGEVQYIYHTSDKVHVHSPTVTACN